MLNDRDDGHIRMQIKLIDCNQGLPHVSYSMQTGESWNACVVPKAIGAYNMDRVSRSLPHLEHFVTWSSIVSHSGNEGTLLRWQKPSSLVGQRYCSSQLKIIITKIKQTRGKTRISELLIVWQPKISI
jgi:hypothetical protein